MGSKTSFWRLGWTYSVQTAVDLIYGEGSLHINHFVYHFVLILFLRPIEVSTMYELNAFGSMSQLKLVPHGQSSSHS